MTSRLDSLERQVVLKASRPRVWRALANAEEFGDWFGVALAGKHFAPGEHVKGNITHPGYEHLEFDVVIELMVPERLLSLRWHPYAIDPAVDYSKEPTTLVEFTLQDADEGTLFQVVESGFDALPEPRRDAAFLANSGGWEHQLRNIEKHVAAP